MEQDLINWETDAWNNSDKVAWHYQRMMENRGSGRLKNEVGVDPCVRYSNGPKLFDVGIGVGQDSLLPANAVLHSSPCVQAPPK